MKVIVHNHLPTRDASPTVQAAIERQAARKADAERGEAEAEKLSTRLKALRNEVKRKTKKVEGGYLVGAPLGYQWSGVADLISKAKAAFGLAAQNSNLGYEGSDYYRWLQKARSELPEAEERLAALERQGAAF